MLMEIPLVGIFIFYVLKNNKEWRDFMREEREAQEKNNEKATKELSRLASYIARLGSLLIYHDATVRGKNDKAVGSTNDMVRHMKTVFDENPEEGFEVPDKK